MITTSLPEDKVDEIRDTIAESKGVCTDHCHKIYILMDEGEVSLMIEYGYTVYHVDKGNVDIVLQRVLDWYESSCVLRFISSIRTVDDPDRNKGFDHIVPQFFIEEDDLWMEGGDDGGPAQEVPDAQED